MIFPPAFLDSSSWNDNQQQHAQHVTASGGGGNHELAVQPSSIMQQQGSTTLPEGGGGQVGPAKPMSMSERARLARVPLPEQGLKCPRCDSGNTKFCYFNNYSLSQPRHFCRACRRYWTRGGALRNVPVGGGYRRHAKRAKPKQQQAALAAAPAPAGGGDGGSSTTASYGCTTAGAANAVPALPAMMLRGGGSDNLSGLLPPLLRLSDFDAMSLGSSFSGMGKPPSSVDRAASCYPLGGAAAGLAEQWRVVQQMQGFPFFHAMDHQQAAALAPAPAAMTTMPGMFHYLGLDSGDDHSVGGNSNGGEDVGGDHHHLHGGMPSKRDQAYYPPRGSIYGGSDHHHIINGGYTTSNSYSNTTTGNHLL